MEHERERLAYKPMENMPQSFRKFNVELCPQGLPVDFETINYEASSNDISYVERFGAGFKIEDLERMFDVFEKLTGTAPFMEEEANCKVTVQKYLQDFDEQIFKEIYQYWRDRRLELKRPLLRMFW